MLERTKHSATPMARRGAKMRNYDFFLGSSFPYRLRYFFLAKTGT
jgi:hypothetical protein